MRLVFHKQSICLAVMVLIIPGCGAPTKSAGDVATIFSDGQTSLNLQDKISSICTILDSRSDHPKLDGLPVKMSGCRDAGRAAVNFKTAKAFQFLGADKQTKDTEEEMYFDVRGQVWLNKTLLGMASALGGLMEKKSANGGAADGLVALPNDQAGALGGLATPKIVQRNTVIDKKNLSVSMEIDFQLKGAIEVELELAVEGRLIEDSFAVTVRTLNKPKFEKSFIKDVSVVAIVTPHAADMYMDVFISLTVYKIGLVDAVVKEQINTFLGSGLKTMIDTAMQL